MNSGKRFEQNFRKSIPKDTLYYRLKDNPSTWGSDKLRFTTSNICDCIVYDGNYLLLLELKSTKGASLSFGNIRNSQLKGLTEYGEYPNVVAGFIINFSDKEECFFLEISKLVNFIESTTRKSIPIEYVKEKGIKIGCIKKRTNYVYDVKKFLDDIVKVI